MFLNRNGLAVSLLSLLPGTSASYNPIGGPITGDITNYESLVSGTPSVTAIFADVVAPSGSTVVVDFAKSTPPGISSPGASSTPSVSPCRGDPCTVTLTPVQFAPSVATWIQHLTTTVTVPEASTPVIHFSAIQEGEPGSGESASDDTTTAVPNSSPSEEPTPGQPPQSGAPAGETTATPDGSPSEAPTPSQPQSSAPAKETTTTSGGAPGTTSNKAQDPGSGAPNTPGSSTPYVPETSSDSTTQSNTDADTSSTPPTRSPPSATNSQSGPKGVPTPSNTKTTPKPSGPARAGSTTAKDTASLTTTVTASDSSTSTTAENASESTTSDSPAVPDGSDTTTSNGHSATGKPPGSKTPSGPAGSTSKAGASTPLAVSSSTTSSNSDPSSTSDGSTSSGTPGTTESGSSSTFAGSTTAETSTGSNASGSTTPTESTPLTTPGPSQTSSTSQSSDSTTSSASLDNVPDSDDMSSMLSTLTGTSSSDVAALLSAEETRAPVTTEAWEDLMNEAPTVTASSDKAAQTTEGVALAGWLTKFNDNVQNSDLTDKDTYDKVKDNLSKTKDRVKNYVENRKSSDGSDGGSSDDSCGSGGGLFSIFKAASCFVNKASNEIEDGSKDIGNLINSGWDLTSQGMSEIEKDLPDVDDITPEIEQEFKDNIKHFTEITESLKNLENENEKDDDNRTESQSQSSTSSSSSTSSDSTTSTTATETTSTSTSTGDSAGITCSPECSACQSAETSADAAAASSYSSYSASFSASISSNEKRGLNVARQTTAPSVGKRANDEDDPYAYLDDPNRTGLEALNYEFFSSRFDAFEEGKLAKDTAKSEASVEVRHTVKGSLTSSRFIDFGRKIARVWVGGLTGCTAVGIVSEQGAWLGHFWESPTMEQESKDTPAWKNQVIDVLKQTDDGDTTPAYPLGATGQALHPDNNVQIFIMTPGDGGSPLYSDTLGWLEDLLTGDDAPWAGVDITRHLYDKPQVDKTGLDEIEDEQERENELAKRTEEAMKKYFTNPDQLNGRMMVEFAPRQTIDPDDGNNHDLKDPPFAMYRILMGERTDQKQWCPHENQQSGDGNNQKRAAACSLPSSSSTSTSSGTSTSTDSTPTDSTSTEKSSGTTTAATTTSSPMCELQIYGSSYSVCTCSSTMGSHTLSHAMLKPTSTDCGDIKTFPMTSFIQVPTATPTSYICVNTPKDINGNQGAFCQCSSTMTKTDATTTDTSQTVAVVSLPYIMGSQTVLDQCADITDFPTDGISATTQNTETQPTRTFTDYTSTDFGNNNKVYVYTAAAEYYDYSKYGIPDITGPVTWTTGIGDPVKEFVHDYTTTNDGGTVYAYAEATGDGDGDVAPVGTPTATSVPEPTHNCVKFVVPAPGDIYNSATEQYLFTMWGIDHWSEAEDIERDIEGVLKDAGVESDISIEAGTGRWGTVAMWNNGRESDMTKEVREGLQGLGMGKPACNWIAKTGFDVNFPVKDSAVEEMDWIEENHPDAIKSPYPLEG